MLVCPACGQENPEGFSFCGSCGKPLADDARRPREERKVVTVLFADLVGFTGRAEQLDPEDVRAMLSPYYARLRVELERRGGTVEKFIGDAVMAVFGAPVAHEDDPERAVRAALAIRDAIRDEDAGLQVRIAVNTGEALVSLDASPSAGEGMAAGDVVNTTARLQSAAPVNGILVGESTYRATRNAIEYREAAPVEAKGKVDPLQVWEAVQAYARIAVETLETGAPLIGRRRELDVLTGALERARQERTPQLVTLVGVPGIGKSRLVYELFKAIESEPDLVFWRQGRALPYGEGVTYWALAEMVKAHAGVLETDSLVDVGQKLTQAVSVVLGDSPEAEWVELHLRLLVGLTPSSDMSGDRRAESFAAWRRFFEALAEQNPLVLIFDDLHWADDNLLDFVDHLVDWASSVPILVVCAARPELLDRRPAWGGGKLNAATVSVTPLSDEETAELIGALLERILLPAEIQATLLAHAGGNPLYAEQFVRMHLERAGDAPALPETVQGIIAARLDILPAAEKALLQDAAVMGKVFWLGAAAAIGELRPDAVETLLHPLERKDFIRRERRSSVAGETEYAFRHVLVQDVAYAQIPRAARAEKHRLAAGWIESLSDDRADDRAEMLAHHYLAALEFARAAGSETADLRERARLALRVAAERAMALSAFAPAARFFESALELWPADDAERPRLLLRCGEALRRERPRRGHRRPRRGQRGVAWRRDGRRSSRSTSSARATPRRPGVAQRVFRRSGSRRRSRPGSGSFGGQGARVRAGGAAERDRRPSRGGHQAERHGTRPGRGARAPGHPGVQPEHARDGQGHRRRPGRDRGSRSEHRDRGRTPDVRPGAWVRQPCVDTGRSRRSQAGARAPPARARGRLPNGAGERRPLAR